MELGLNFKRYKCSFGQYKNVYYKEVNGIFYYGRPFTKYEVCRWKSWKDIDNWARRNGYKEVKKFVPLTEVQWLDKVCQNFKEDGYDF